MISGHMRRHGVGKAHNSLISKCRASFVVIKTIQWFRELAKLKSRLLPFLMTFFSSLCNIFPALKFAYKLSPLHPQYPFSLSPVRRLGLSERPIVNHGLISISTSLWAKATLYYYSLPLLLARLSIEFLILPPALSQRDYGNKSNFHWQETLEVSIAKPLYNCKVNSSEMNIKQCSDCKDFLQDRVFTLNRICHEK